MIADREVVRFYLAQLLLSVSLTLLLTYFSLAIADNVGTPQFLRYVFSPGYVLGIHFASGTTFGETLSSFLRTSFTVNVAYRADCLGVGPEDQLAKAAEKSPPSFLDGTVAAV